MPLFNPVPIREFLTVAEMAAFQTGALPKGTEVFVRQLVDTWTLDPVSVLVPDGITVIAATGGGNWLRENVPSLEWAAQAAWFIDPVGGSDLNDGATAPTALQTPDEFFRRVGNLPITQSTLVQINGNVSRIDGILNVQGAGFVRFRGTATTIFTSNVAGFTAVTSLVRSTNTPNQVTDANIAASWTASGLVGNRIRTTTGANTGSVAWVVKDQGAKVARISAWVIPSSAPPYPTFYTPNTVAVGNNYVVETLSTVGAVNLQIYTNATAQPSIVFQDLRITGRPAILVNGDANFFGGLTFVACHMDTNVSTILASFCTFEVCKFSISTTNISGFGQFFSCYMAGSLSGFGGYEAVVDGDTIIQGGGLLADYKINIGSLAIFDRAGPVTVIEGGNVFVSDIFGLGGAIYGSGNTGTNISIVGPGTLESNVALSGVLFITGGATYANVGGVTKTLAQLPYSNVTNGAGIFRSGSQIPVDTCVEQAVDVATSSIVFVDLLTQAVTTVGEKIMDFYADVGLELVNAAVLATAFFRITLDGVAVRGTSCGNPVAALGEAQSVALSCRNIAVAAGAHTIKLQWRVSVATATANIRPVTVPDGEHATLRVRQANI